MRPAFLKISKNERHSKKNLSNVIIKQTYIHNYVYIITCLKIIVKQINIIQQKIFINFHNIVFPQSVLIVVDRGAGVWYNKYS